MEKNKVLQHYKQLVQDKLDIFQDMIHELALDAQNDAKGSAGDKHETALSMMHLEQEKLNQKVAEINQQKNILDQIDATQKHQVAALGSLIKTNGMYLFVSCAMPKISINKQTIIALSPQSPLGKQIIGKKIGYEFSIQNTIYTIEDVI
ncbi:hypothetical protein B0A58_01420 [Flavobacterium branchiophilum NBRC 15030 = ATCC 35035]|uniref:Uncharacterized protein n=2 Tax=Flavobacterium branchiophilum TaxID=55197 RepID=G2YZT7_FLABF|nr:hypothetical protein [Flavobacterium branchiophilum]OXA81584.1 hypothetical protein B0A58_01420 [Flavobacterium branchiophilum NBRC 15030 = ATCC 35035]PDS25034.1 hypothetical protein B0A77_06170 [Flavobacterium branchiophilum]TQM41610.1 hypothetical protein BC670_2596 [Flavobacterium branchiophilum]CCB69190.1 Protein of unknown function [Flavobacterium branchiophilum FL-15]GEM55287.1 hypothetical protein FB1_15080 [Flavobacterium branchiophilum NBRC 15030 = ATCC 35035]